MPNAPDVLAPRAEELVKWCERQVSLHERAMAERSLPQWATDRERELAEHFRHMIEVLRERDVLAAAILKRERDYDVAALANVVREALRDLHAKGAKP